MEKEALKRIFDFLEEKGEHNAPFRWKIINNKPITKEDLKVGGDLNLFKSKITSLPKGLKVGGKLILSYCENISSLPEGLIVRGNLYVRGTELQKYSEEELREMIRPGFIDGEIFR